MAVTGSEWASWPRFSRYEASHRGLIRNRAGKLLAARPDDDDYLRTTLTRDDGKRIPVSVARAVLEAHAGPCPDGMETCHGRGGRQDNRYPENLRWCTKAENNGADKAEFGIPASPNPTYPCKDGCGNLVIHENRRCVDCVERVKVEAAAMLNRRINLWDVAEHFGYTGVDWVWKLAVEGGYAGTKRDALTQQPPLSRRVMATVRDRMRPKRAVTHRDG